MRVVVLLQIDIAHVINISYQHVAASTLTAMLGGLEGSDLERFASAQGWQAKGENYFIGNKVKFYPFLHHRG